MTILQALNGYYDRMAARGEAEAPGFSREKISFAITLSDSGKPLEVVDLRAVSGKKLVARVLEVPAAIKRASGIAPNLLWDKTAYVLGRTGGEGHRTFDEHAAFKTKHLKLLSDATDVGLLALRRFIEGWQSERFDASPFSAEMLDANVVFRWEGDRDFLHERAAAKDLIAHQTGEGTTAFCLVTGSEAPVRRLHPSIKGVQGAQTAGASLVSFNLDAFSSYGKEQGANAPTSEAAAFRYGAALNRMLDRGSRNRLRRGIGDATVAFWADTSDTVDEAAAEAAEATFVLFADPPDRANDDEDAQEAIKISDALDKLAAGRPVEELNLGLRSGTRFHVLGLAPNAARLSVRYWLDDSFEAFARRLAEHHRDLAIEPRPRGWKSKPPSISRLLVKTTALQEKFDNIPPLLAGEVTRAVLAGSPYPRTLLTAAITRLRAGDDPGSGWHAAVIKACLNRTEKEKAPVALEPDNPSTAYQLGRLFYVLESAQRAALGRVNATIADRYYGAASATPARVFGPLLRGLRNHVSDARKRGQGGWIEPKVSEIMSKLPPNLPPTLRLEDQGRFAVGYYHERGTRPAKGSTTDETEGETVQ